MSTKVNKLLAAYRQQMGIPWQAGLAAIQRVIFAVYDIRSRSCQCSSKAGIGP